jgi:hypothetical protein
MSDIIYVAVVNEGTDCWRPVHADHVEDDVYEITVDDPPGDEQWDFPAHAQVRCREHAFIHGEKALVAFERVR